MEIISSYGYSIRLTVEDTKFLKRLKILKKKPSTYKSEKGGWKGGRGEGEGEIEKEIERDRKRANMEQSHTVMWFP